LRGGKAVKGLPAIGALLVQTAEEVIGLCRCDPFGDAGFCKLGTQRLYLLRGTIGTIPFPIGSGAFLLYPSVKNPELLAQRFDGTFERPNVHLIMPVRLSLIVADCMLRSYA
jgi:hypothetical protein